jgi:uncharacterized protein
MVRIFYTCDLHGSEVCWKKFLRAAEHYKASVLMIGGDLTGKLIVPLIEQPDGSRVGTIFGTPTTLRNEVEVQDAERRIKDAGYYPVRMTQPEVEKLQARRSEVDALFDRVMTETLRRWLSWIPERLAEDVSVVLIPGNDDRFCIDPILRESPRVTFPENEPIWIEGHAVVPLSHVNPTPWNSPRECSETEMARRIDAVFTKVPKDDLPRSLALFHAPPYRSGLDVAPKLDKSLRPMMGSGGTLMVPVGSTAVRDALEKYQPLMGLHGHIHESPARATYGHTLAVNPGSEYGEGILKGYVIDLDRDRVKDFRHVEG